MRRTRFLSNSIIGAICAENARTRRNTESTPSREFSSMEGSDKSPRTTSTESGRPAVSGLRVKARTELPAPESIETTLRPTLPVAPVTKIAWRARCVMGFPFANRVSSSFQFSKLQVKVNLKSSRFPCYFFSMADLLTISEVARRSGVAASALRFYERRGLIRSERAGSGRDPPLPESGASPHRIRGLWSTCRSHPRRDCGGVGKAPARPRP